MDHAKFCIATQDWSTPETGEDFVFLRRAANSKQEEDHGRCRRAMALRRALSPNV